MTARPRFAAGSIHPLTVLLTLLLAGARLAAQETVRDGAAATPPPAVSPAAPAAAAATEDRRAPVTIPKVVGVVSHVAGRPKQAGLGERISVEVQPFDEALERHELGCEGLVLFLDGIPILDMPPQSCDPETGRVRFALDRTERNDEAWHVLLGAPDGFTRPIQVSVGPRDHLSFASEVDDFELEVLPRGWFLGFCVLMAAGLAVFVRLARRTSILRDPHVVAPPGQLAPYSLARFQLAFWSFLVIFSYVFIWMITEELDTITGSVLTLLGIGSGTALGASLIDAGKEQESAPRAAAPAETGAAVAAEAAPPVLRGSRGFLADILEDAQGMSFYRFQLFAWTLVLGIIFCASVYNKLAMPEFSPTLLALMGISSGTFLGAKFPEK